MTLTTISQSTPQVLSQSVVYEYSYSLINKDDNDIQDNMTAAFRHIPTTNDWANRLSGWSSIGYQFHSQPQLIRII